MYSWKACSQVHSPNFQQKVEKNSLIITEWIWAMFSGDELRTMGVHTPQVPHEMGVVCVTECSGMFSGYWCADMWADWGSGQEWNAFVLLPFLFTRHGREAHESHVVQISIQNLFKWNCWWILGHSYRCINKHRQTVCRNLLVYLCESWLELFFFLLSLGTFGDAGDVEFNIHASIFWRSAESDLVKTFSPSLCGWGGMGK